MFGLNPKFSERVVLPQVLSVALETCGLENDDVSKSALEQTA
jgi:hypothetical protein